MNIKQLKADLVLHHLEETQLIDRTILMEDAEFLDLLTRLINQNEESKRIESLLSAYIEENY